MEDVLFIVIDDAVACFSNVCVWVKFRATLTVARTETKPETR